MTERNKKKNGGGELEAARRVLRGAENLLRAGLYPDAVSRAYYAAFHAIRAFLFARGIQVKSHEGLRTALHREFIRTGVLPASVGKAFNDLMESRGVADYGDPAEVEGLDAAKAKELVHLAQSFVATLEIEVKKALGE